MRKSTIEELDYAATTAGLTWIPKDGITVYIDNNGTLTRLRSISSTAEAIAYMEGYAQGYAAGRFKPTI